jgi:hypothetical protein
MSRSGPPENRAGFPEKSGFVVEFVRGQNQVEFASFCAPERRETRNGPDERLLRFEKRIV